MRERHGWTDLVLGPDRPARVVTGLVTGWHAPGASHLALLAAVAGGALVERAYAEAVRFGAQFDRAADGAFVLDESDGVLRTAWRCGGNRCDRLEISVIRLGSRLPVRR